MKFNFHHKNLCTENVQRLTEFYQSLFDLGTVSYERIQTDNFYGERVDFITDGHVEFHIARRDVNLGYRMKHFVNPLHSGHFCFRTDDIDGLKRRLEEKKVPYSDYGVWAVKGWYQIFFHDPDGNVIEVHQPGM
jgi:glyoxylase I family protein